jgi:hypothetical protein
VSTEKGSTHHFGEGGKLGFNLGSAHQVRPENETTPEKNKKNAGVNAERMFCTAQWMQRPPVVSRRLKELGLNEVFSLGVPMT